MSTPRKWLTVRFPSAPSNFANDFPFDFFFFPQIGPCFEAVLVPRRVLDLALRLALGHPNQQVVKLRARVVRVRASRRRASSSTRPGSPLESQRSSTPVSIASNPVRGSSLETACVAPAARSYGSASNSQTQSAKRSGPLSSLGPLEPSVTSRSGTATRQPPPVAAASTSRTATPSSSRHNDIACRGACALEQLAIPGGDLSRAPLVRE